MPIETNAQALERIVRQNSTQEYRPYTSGNPGWANGPWKIRDSFSPVRTFTLHGRDLSPPWWNPARKAEFAAIYWPDVLPWGEIFCASNGAGGHLNTATNCRAEVSDITLQVLRNGVWATEGNQMTVGGAGYRYDYAGDQQVSLDVKTSSGRVSVKPAADGQSIFHFWGAGQSPIANVSGVQAVACTARFKLIQDNPNLPFDWQNCYYVGKMGCDAYPSGARVSDYAPETYNPGLGGSGFFRLTPQEQFITMIVLYTDEIRANPPPSLQPPTSTSRARTVITLGTSMSDGSDPGTVVVPPSNQFQLVAYGSGLSSTSAEYQRFWGPGLNRLDKLAFAYTQRLSGRDYAADMIIRSSETGPMTGIKVYLPDLRDSPSGGYAGGNGGTLRVSVYADNGSGGLGTQVGSTNYVVQMGARIGAPAGCFANAAGMFPTIPLSANLVAGVIYHFVFEQVDANPGVNFINPDYIATSYANGRPNPFLAANEWAGRSGYRPAGSNDGIPYTWRNYTDSTDTGTSSGVYYAPIIQINMASGKRQGCSIMESGSVASYQYSLTSANACREHFTPAAAKSFRGVTLYTAATAPGTMAINVIVGGSTVSTGSIVQATANYSETLMQGTQFGNFQRYDVLLSSLVTVAPGQEFDVEFKPVSGTWRLAVQLNGGSFGFVMPAAFLESQARHLQGGSWINSGTWQHTSSTQDKGNWPVVLHTGTDSGPGTSTTVSEAQYVSHIGPMYQDLVANGYAITLSGDHSRPRRNNRSPGDTYGRGGASMNPSASTGIYNQMLIAKTRHPSGPYTDFIGVIEGGTNDGGQSAAQVASWWGQILDSWFDLFPGSKAVCGGVEPVGNWFPTATITAVRNTILAKNAAQPRCYYAWLEQAGINTVPQPAGDLLDDYTHYADSGAVKAGIQYARVIRAIEDGVYNNATGEISGGTTPVDPDPDPDPGTPGQAGNDIPDPIPHTSADVGIWGAVMNGSDARWFDDVVIPPPAAAITTTELPQARVGQAYSFAMSGTGTGVLTFFATGLPPGMQMSPEGLITSTGTAGEHLVPGSYSVRISIGDDNGMGAAVTYALLVRPAVVAVRRSSPWAAKVTRR